MLSFDLNKNNLMFVCLLSLLNQGLLNRVESKTKMSEIWPKRKGLNVKRDVSSGNIRVIFSCFRIYAFFQTWTVIPCHENILWFCTCFFNICRIDTHTFALIYAIVYQLTLAKASLYSFLSRSVWSHCRIAGEKNVKQHYDKILSLFASLYLFRGA